MADVQLTFGADASPIEAASEESVAGIHEIQNATTGLMAAMVELGEVATAVFAELGAAPRRAGTQVMEVAEQIKGMREALMSVGEAVVAAFAVEQIASFVEKMGEASEKVLHTATAFGESTDEVQKLQGIATATGASLDALSTAGLRLDRALGQANAGGKKQQEVFAELGISTTKARTQYELINETLAAFANQDASIDRVQMATTLFGRNIQGIAPLLGITKDQMSEYNDQIERFGVVNANAVAQGVGLAESNNSLKNAFAGLNNVLTEALAPAFRVMVDGITEFVAAMTQSYQQGGLMKDILDILATIVLALSIVFQEVAEVIATVWSAITGGAPTSISLLQIIKLAVDGLLAAFVVAATGVRVVFYDMGEALNVFEIAIVGLGKIIFDALTGNWGAIQGDFQNGLNQLVARTQKAQHDIAGMTTDMLTKLNQISAGGRQAGAPNVPTPHRSTGDAFGDGKNKAAKSRVPEWEEELHQMEALSNDFFGDQTAKELAYWTDKLALTTAKSKEWYSIQEKIYELNKSAAKAARTEALDDVKAQAQQQSDAAKASLTVVMDSLNARSEAIKASKSRGDITSTTEADQLRAVLDQETAAQQAYEDRIYQIKLDQLNKDAVLYATDPVNLQKTLDAKQVAYQKHQDDLTTIAAKASQDRSKIDALEASNVEKDWEKTLQPIATNFNTLFQSMLSGSQTFGQAMLKIADNMVMGWVESGEKWLIHWIAQQEAATAVKAASAAQGVAIDEAAATESVGVSAIAALKKLAHAAAVAAGNAYAALAGIPIIGPVLGAVAAAATFAAVLAFGGSIASAAGGQDQVTSDGQLTELHRNEMVLSAKYANPLRDMLAGASFGNAGTAANAGRQASSGAPASQTTGHTFHYAPTIHNSNTDWDTLVQKEGTKMRKWLGNQARYGNLKMGTA
jgi:hypothetical protein